MKKTTVFEFAIVFTLLFNPVLHVFPVKSNGKVNQTDVVAHRGASGTAPENTITAFDKALEMKADYIELDVQRSKDGELVIIHDLTVDRTTNGKGAVKDLSFQQLKQFDAGSWKGDQFIGAKIPAFEEILDRYHGKIGMLIELKSPELYPGIEKQVARVLKERNLDQPHNGKIIIQSFNHDSMKKMNRLLPKVLIGVLISKKEHTAEQALKEFSSYADYYNPHYKLLNNELVHQANAYGMKVSPWTVRSHESAEFVLGMSTEAIITDYPEYVNSTEKSIAYSFVK